MEFTWISCSANLKDNVLPNGLDPVGYELVDNVPWVISPFSHTMCVYVQCMHNVDV